MKTKDLVPPPQTVMTPSWDLLKPSVNLALANWEQILYLFLLPSLVYALGYLLLGDTTHIHHLGDLSQRQKLGVASLVVGGLWSLINLAPAFYFRVKTTAKHSVSIGECYQNGLPYFWRLLGLLILTGLIVLGGFILLIVPGCLFIRRYYLASYYMIDQNLGIIESLKRSSHDSKAVSGYVWGVIGVQIVFSVISGGLSSIPVAGIIAGSAVGYVCLFLPVLRYREIVAATPVED